MAHYTGQWDTQFADLQQWFQGYRRSKVFLLIVSTRRRMSFQVSSCRANFSSSFDLSIIIKVKFKNRSQVLTNGLEIMVRFTTIRTFAWTRGYNEQQDNSARVDMRKDNVGFACNISNWSETVTESECQANWILIWSAQLHTYRSKNRRTNLWTIDSDAKWEHAKRTVISRWELRLPSCGYLKLLVRIVQRRAILTSQKWRWIWRNRSMCQKGAFSIVTRIQPKKSSEAYVKYRKPSSSFSLA